MDDGTRKREKLALSGGEVVSSLPHRLVEAVIQLVDKLVSIHVMADVHDLLIGNPLLTENNVATDRSREQEDILQHLAEFFPQGIDLDLSDVDAVDQNLTLLEQIRERIVDFPEPVEPTNAIVSFGLTWNETPFNTHSPGI